MSIVVPLVGFVVVLVLFIVAVITIIGGSEPVPRRWVRSVGLLLVAVGVGGACFSVLVWLGPCTGVGDACAAAVGSPVARTDGVCPPATVTRGWFPLQLTCESDAYDPVQLVPARATWVLLLLLAVGGALTFRPRLAADADCASPA